MEINAMQSNIKKSSFALNELAFQSLPRGLRRRAASHNLNRLPARLRAKAAREAHSSAPGTPLIRKKVKKIKPPGNIVQEFLRRQKSKKWLETHMWHTKRMKMTDIWGHRIAARPNTKSVRVTYRSFTRLSIVHDASYMACIELAGHVDSIATVLNTLTDAGLPSVTSERYIKGNRMGTTHLYEYMAYPTRLICPISFLWKPQTKDTLWLWIHPAAINEALCFIKKAIEETKMEVQLNDLREELLRFELTGPRSTSLLQSILDPVANKDSKGNQTWKDLHQLRSSCSLSPGSVLGLVVNDPRLRFPQKVPPRNNQISIEEQQTIQKILEHWPSNVAETSIWDKSERDTLCEKKASEYALNLRRQENLVPGTKLQPNPTDAQIPILLIQRGGPAYNKAGITQKPLSSHELVEGWTLILPRGWGLPFWKSLVFAGARVAGFEDVRAMHFESGFPCFPQDYPGTRAFEVHRQLMKKEAEKVWEKRPPAKRVNFGKRGIEHPFECAFESLATVEHMEIDNAHNLPPRPTCTLIQGERLVRDILTDAFETTLETLTRQRGLEGEKQTPQLDDALIKIRVKYIDRGKPAPYAMVYLLEDYEEYDQCTFHIRHQSPLKKSKRKLKELLEVQTDISKKSIAIPEKPQHIGYITNGNFSLTLGYGFGVGACTVNGLKKMDAIDALQKRTMKKMVLVRNPSSLEVRAAQLEVLC
ncbi:NUC188 domain-containing protein [Mucor mucedo]|uniref:NUC188 domain-containing protein n=1 Tax=Mucor mucedo TaxID=29922 RepID=UPI00221EB287|nr:NUC188 domain-containing protein [Mucor mucedo]KAI7892348.1 NUC188 domain-containing protein [Mucor mucedo]